MKALLTGLIILVLLLYVDWKFIRNIFNRASSAGEQSPEEKLKRMIVDVTTKDIYVAEMEEFIQSREFYKLLEEYGGEDLDEKMEKKIEECYRSYLRRKRNNS